MGALYSSFYALTTIEDEEGIAIFDGFEAFDVEDNDKSPIAHAIEPLTERRKYSEV